MKTKARITTGTGKLRSKWRDRISTIIWAALLAFAIRALVFQSFVIPTSSMQPNILAGDRIVVSKYAYGYGAHSFRPVLFPKGETRWLSRMPMRGDVVVFRKPQMSKTFAKRVIGLPGDTISLSSAIVSINGIKLKQEFLSEVTSIDVSGNPSLTEVYREILPNGTGYPVYDSQKNSDLDNLQAIKVPDGYYFVLGDSRDVSKDSRLSRKNGGIGLVAHADLIGRAEFVLMSVAPDFSLTRPSTWSKLRTNRTLKDIP